MLVVNGGNTSALGELGDLPPSLIVHVPSTPKSSAAQWDDLKKKVINNDVEGFMPTAHIIVNEMQYIHRAQSVHLCPFQIHSNHIGPAVPVFIHGLSRHNFRPTSCHQIAGSIACSAETPSLAQTGLANV